MENSGLIAICISISLIIGLVVGFAIGQAIVINTIIKGLDTVKSIDINFNETEIVNALLSYEPIAKQLNGLK